MGIKQVQKLLIQMGKGVDVIRSEAGSDSDPALENVLNEAIAGFNNPQLQEAVQLIFQDPIARQAILQNAHLLIKAIPEYNKIAAEIVFKKNCGESGEEVTLVDEDGVEDTVKLIRARFIEAVFTPEKASKQINELEDIIRTQEDSTAAQRLRREIVDAGKVAEASREAIMQFGQLLQLTYQQEQDGSSILRSFLQDLILLHRLDFVVTDRLANRFANSFLIINRTGNVASRLKSAMLNYVGEYVLICMGIIDPNIFTLHKSEIKYNQLLKSDLTEVGVDLEELLARYKLQGAGTLFWNRYFVTGQRPTAVTDNLIRDFITRTVRESGDEILECIGFDDKLQKIISSMEEAREERLGKEDKKNLLRQKCVEIFIDEEFVKFLTKKIKDEWKDKLSIFYS